MIRVFFACLHNAGRSQMAAAFFNSLADREKARAESGGTDPADRVNPVVVDAMQEVGLDLSGAQPKHLTAELAAGATWLITMGCGDQCPVVPGLRREDWQLDDPAGQPLDVVRAIREEVWRNVLTFVERERLD